MRPRGRSITVRDRSANTSSGGFLGTLFGNNNTSSRQAPAGLPAPPARGRSRTRRAPAGLPAPPARSAPTPPENDGPARRTRSRTQAINTNACPARENTIQPCDENMTPIQKKRIYRSQTRTFHPDKNPGCEEYAKEKFQELQNSCDQAQ